ncbi:MAG: ATP-binding cassette domain-containing protein, partial [Jiangellaceae bacterium]
TDVRALLLSVAPPRIQAAAARVDGSELALMDLDDEPTQMAYAVALADWADAGGYEIEVLWDVCTTAAIGVPFERCLWRDVASLSGGEQKRLVLEALLRGPDEVLLLDEPDNFLDVPAKRWLEERLNQSAKTVLYVSHDRELLARTATRIVTIELGAAGNTAWVHPGGFASYHEARRDRFARLEELRRRWDEDHARLKALVLMYKQKAAYNSDMAKRYQAAQTRLRKFVEAGPPEAQPRDQNVRMRLRGGRTGKRAVMCERLELTGLMKPFDLEVWYGERVAVLGSNGSGKSHFLRVLAAGGTDPDIEHQPVDDVPIAPVAHTGTARLGARVRPGWFAQTHEHPELAGRTLLEILHRGDGRRKGMPREEASRALDRYELAYAADQNFDSLSGGQQARFQIL